MTDIWEAIRDQRMKLQALEKEAEYQKHYSGINQTCAVDPRDLQGQAECGQMGLGNPSPLTPTGSTNELIEQLRRMVAPVWDGYLQDRGNRDTLAKFGLVDRTHGWNYLTAKGVEYCVALGILRA